MNFVPNRAKITSRHVPPSRNRRKCGFSAPISPLDPTFEIGCNSNIKGALQVNALTPVDPVVPMETNLPNVVQFRNNLRQHVAQINVDQIIHRILAARSEDSGGIRGSILHEMHLNIIGILNRA